MGCIYTVNYLLFNSYSDAANAVSQINANMGCPIIAINALTSIPDPHAQQTITWDAPLLWPDGVTWSITTPDQMFMDGVIYASTADAIPVFPDD